MAGNGVQSDGLRYLRRVIEKRIQILQEVKQTVNPKHKQIYECNIEVLKWVLTQFPKIE